MDPTKKNRPIVLVMLMALVAAAFAMLGPTAQAAATTNATAATATCPTHLWERDIARSHEEYKFKKSVPDFKTQHWAKYQKHVKGRVEKKYGNSWYDTGVNFDWTKWEGDFWNTSGSFKIRDWSDTPSPDVIEEGGHSSISDTYQQNGYTYRWVSEYYSYRVIARETRQIQTGSHWEYYLPGGGSSLTNTDANWTTETPGAPWVQFDQRTVQDQPIHQGPVRSVNEPDRAPYPNVPWTKIPGTEEPCPTPPPSDECPYIDGNQPPDTDCTPDVRKPRASVNAYCVTENIGEGVARLNNKKSTVLQKFRIKGAGINKLVKVRAGKSKPVNLFGLKVGGIVKVLSGGEVLDHDKVEMRPVCQPAPPPHTGSKVMKVLKQAFLNRFRAAPA